MRLIDADRFDKELDELEKYASLELSAEIFRIKARLATQPNVDAEPVRHGHWIKSKDGTFMSPCYECSICGRKINTWDTPVKSAPYCHCGAKMDEEVNDV